MSIIKLITTDGKEIEVEDYFLKAHSSVIRDMFSIPTPSSDNPKDFTLDIKLDSTLAQILVDFVESPETNVKITRVDEAEKLLDACDFFALNALRKATLLALEAFCIDEDSLWDVFCTASRYKVPRLAQAALRAVEETNHDLRLVPALEVSMEMAQQCELDYLLAYYDAVDWRRRNDGETLNWHKLAEDFHPRRMIGAKV